MPNNQKQSHRHHYVSQFYINYFKDKEGKLTGYNKITKQFFPPNSKDIFFEEKRNTFKNEFGENSDRIEKLYSNLEGKFAAVYKKVSETRILEKEDLRLLLFFAYTTKWRSPQYDDSFEDAKKTLSFQDLRLLLIDHSIEMPIDLEDLWYSEEMQAFKRILIAAQLFLYKDDYADVYKKVTILNNPYSCHAILGECPFNENPAQSNVVFESFVLPLSSTDTLCYHRDFERAQVEKMFYEDNNFRTVFSNLRDISTFHLTNKLVIGDSKERIEEIISLYNEVSKRTDTRLCTQLIFQYMKDFIK